MTNSAEGDLEAVIWAAMTAFKVTTTEPLEFIEAIKAAAMDYAAGDSDALTETRRMILHEATRPERIDRPEVAGGGGQPARREQYPPGSRARPTGGATLSTGPSVPYPGQGLFKLRPQAVDNRPPDTQAAAGHAGRRRTTGASPMNDELTEERDWLSGLLDEFEDLELTDRGMGMGQADLCYERDSDDEGGRRRVCLTIRIEDE